MNMFRGTVGVLGREVLINNIRSIISNNINYEQLKFSFFNGMFEDAYKQLVNEIDDIDVFISGSRHSHLLCLWFPDKPVLTVKPLLEDILICVEEASRIDNNIYILPANENFALDHLVSLIKSNIVIHQFSFHDIDSLKRLMSRIKNEGGKVVIGGSVVCDVAPLFDLKSFFYYTNETIKKALDEAKNIIKVKIDQKEYISKIHKIIDLSDVGLMIVGNDQKIEIINHNATKMLGLNDSVVVGADVNKILPKTTNLYKDKRSIISINGLELLVDISAILGGTVYRFNDVTKVEEASYEIRRHSLLKQSIAKYEFKDIVGSGLNSIIEIAKSYSLASDANVLIMGPTGSGKELFASSIHNGSTRAKSPFIPVNCAALPENLLESELFGYDTGAFTGANKKGKKGLIELAHNGTLFLDEIGEMPFSLQAKLLRVLQEKEVLHIGGNVHIPVNIRVIAATNCDLEDLIEKKKFRPDLYYRLATLLLNIPPLSARRSDIYQLMAYYLNLQDLSHGTKDVIIRVVSSFYKDYEWPGNVREVQNIIERTITYLKYSNKLLMPENKLSHDLTKYMETSGEIFKLATKAEPLNKIKCLQTDYGFMENREKAIDAVLKSTGGNKSKAAKLLGVSRSTLWRRRRKADNANKSVQKNAACKPRKH
jgi:transcriptional regulator, propionate catabolism operon regulatory protein